MGVKVSIIVPVFNVKRYLSECLDSILNQTLTDIEIICGDGGSTDGSLEILNDYSKKDSRIKVISKSGSGYGQSVNDCMDIATGEYIGIVESDDCVRPEMYEKLYDRAKNLNLDWVRGDIYLYYSERPVGSQLVKESIVKDNRLYDFVLNPQNDYRPYRSGLRTWSGIYSTKFLNDHSIRHNETPGGSYQDVGFFLKTFYYAKRVSFIKEAFYMWRQDNPNSSINYDSWKIVNKSLNEWKKDREYLEAHANLGPMAYGSYNYRKYLSYCWTIQMSNGPSRDYAEGIAREELSAALKNGEIDRRFFQRCEWIDFNIMINPDSLRYRVLSKMVAMAGVR